MQLTAEKVIELITPIPEESFMTNDFSDGKDRCCVMGHLCRLMSKNPEDYSYDNCYEFGSSNPELSKFRDKTNSFLIFKYGEYSTDISDVNNFTYVNGYNQPTPKLRVMTFLQDMLVWEKESGTKMS